MIDVDIESRPYWDALREHRVIVQRCDACGRARFPLMPTCPYCGARGRTQVETSARGAVYSYVRVRRALTPAMEGEVPYTVAVVQLDDGPRVIGRVDAEVGIGDAVEPRFVDHEGDGWTELRFAPACDARNARNARNGKES